MPIPADLPLIPSPVHDLAVAAVSTPFAAALIGAGRDLRNRVKGHRRRVAEDAGLRALVAALDARDHYTGNHSEAVVGLASAVARNLGLPDAAVNEVQRVALLHDIGKIGIPDRILNKRGPLSIDEWEVMKTHPIIGERMIASLDGLSHLSRMLRAEHERWDGTGYPDGLSGRAIPLASRIVLACDAFHAMVSDRPYRMAMGLDAAISELASNSGKQFCPDTVVALIGVIRSA